MRLSPCVPPLPPTCYSDPARSLCHPFPPLPQPTPQQGARRVQAEFKHLDADIRANKFGFVKELSLPGDDLHVWELKLWAFDDNLQGGKALNQDLARLKQQ